MTFDKAHCLISQYIYILETRFSVKKKNIKEQSTFPHSARYIFKGYEKNI